MTKRSRVAGEAPEIVVLQKEVNVLCVTKAHSDEQDQRMKEADIVRITRFHQPITGKAVVKATGVQMGEQQVPADITVEFNGTPCEFLYYRTGLGGCVHVIAVRAPEQPEYHDVWELYTDELTDKGVERGFNSEQDVQEPSDFDATGGHKFGAPDPAYKDAVPGLIIEAVG